MSTTSLKRKSDNSKDKSDPSTDSDKLTIKPLGAGQEVGRSCVILQFKGKKIMLDCGIHPGMNGFASLPFLDFVDIEEIDLLLITHFHLDHSGALPYILQKTAFKGRCFMTHATKAIYRWLLSDYVKVSNIASEDMLYTEKDIESSMDKIETVNFHQETDISGIKFTCYNAGHVLGAAMFMVEIAGVKILYTGDFSRQEDRHLMAAELPVDHPEVVITESTYGIKVHENREERESRFTKLVHNIIHRGGRCLIPVFALGRAQELLLILDEYWSCHPELHDVPIYYASSLAKKCMSVYQTYVNAMNERIRRQIAISNPFIFKHISNLKSMEHFEDIGPCVVMASPGMMQSGLSRELFESWCTDKRNGTIIAGYCVEGTLAKQILSEPDEITTMNGMRLPLKCSVDYISFSAHTDYQQTSQFLRELRAPHVVLVHGEQNEMARLKTELIRQYEFDESFNINVYNPKNTESVELHFRGEKTAKVVGNLAAKKPVDSQQLSGVLVKHNFNYHLMSPKDITNYTDLVKSTIQQRVGISYTGALSTLQYHLSQLAADLKPTSNNSVALFGGITVTLENQLAVIEWVSNPVTDMYSDAVMALIMRAEKGPSTPEGAGVCKIDNNHFRECVREMLTDMFGSESVGKLIVGDKLTLTVDDHEVVINLITLDVACPDETLSKLVGTAVNNLHRAIFPIQV